MVFTLWSEFFMLMLWPGSMLFMGIWCLYYGLCLWCLCFVVGSLMSSLWSRSLEFSLLCGSVVFMIWICDVYGIVGLCLCCNLGLRCLCCDWDL